MTPFKFPAEAFMGEPKRAFKVVGKVRTKVNYPTLDSKHDENQLCKNYFNKAAIDLVHRAKDQGADAVVDIRSIVFLVDGRVETYPSPECADEGDQGQILAEGKAVKWVDPKPPAAEELKKDKAKKEPIPPEPSTPIRISRPRKPFDPMIKQGPSAGDEDDSSSD